MTNRIGCGIIIKSPERNGKTGVSPSGKATDSDSVIRGFKSLHPNQRKRSEQSERFLFFRADSAVRSYFTESMSHVCASLTKNVPPECKLYRNYQKHIAYFVHEWYNDKVIGARAQTIPTRRIDQNQTKGVLSSMNQFHASNIKNIALAGHHSSGKTSLAEALLHLAGASDRFGKVADGTTVCDFDAEEVKRQSSLSTALAGFSYEEIAAEEGISRVAVWKHLSHALNQIRNHFKK